MRANIIHQLFPQLLSSFSTAPTYACFKLASRHVKTLLFQQAKKFSVSTDISVSDPMLHKHLERIEEKYVRSLSEGKDFDLNLADEFKENINIKGVRKFLHEIATVRQDIGSLQELNSEKTKDMDDLVKEEMKSYEVQLINLKNQLLEALIPQDEEDYFKNVIVEVNAGVGGQEAMLFAAEIFQMYSNYAQYKSWDSDVMEMSMSDIGGIRRACLQISGADSCCLMRFEGGVHRVQRIPKTEKTGRMHTSTISVAVLPQPNETDIVLLDKDLKIETKRASGAGGQHVNVTDSAVRIVHLPTGIAVECQTQRFQHKNKEIALQKLRAVLYQKERDKQDSKISSSRKIQIGSKGRSEKIRTYNYNQDRVTDHRISKNMHNLASFLEGGPPLNEMINLVYNKYKREQLEMLLESITST